uniref:Uncharacterized protein n=1 Tax=Planktothricoides sp. SpSt-374 TaxID=2282167 RepID=A0A7C3ZXH4_9CYAN
MLNYRLVMDSRLRGNDICACGGGNDIQRLPVSESPRPPVPPSPRHQVGERSRTAVTPSPRHPVPLPSF